MAIASTYTNEACFCGRGNYGEGATKTVCGKVGGPRHWSHERCLRQWAQQKRGAGIPDAQINCPLLGDGVCNTNLAHLLPPVPQKGCLERASDFFWSRGWKIAVVPPICLLGAVYIAGGAIIAATGVRSSQGRPVQGAAEVDAMIGTALLTGALATVRGAVTAGVGAGMLLGGQALFLGRLPQLRRMLITGALPAAAVGANILASGGGLLAAAALASGAAATAGAIFFGLKKIAGRF